MPIYEYRCEACGHTLDALQKISDAKLSECPSCDEAALKRLISAPSFRLKGSGWYETDFKSDKENKRNLAEGSQKDSGEKAGEGGKSKSDDDKPKKTSDDQPKAKEDKKPVKDKDKDKATDKAKDKGKDKGKGKGSEAA
jgi:putative FmdB family regulatory protein